MFGFLVGSPLQFLFVKQCAILNWGEFGLLDVEYNTCGSYTFVFSKANSVTMALAVEKLILKDCVLVLKPWLDTSKFSYLEEMSHYAWITVSGIPIAYRDFKGLSYIVSAVGLIIVADQPNPEDLETDRALIYMKDNRPRPSRILIQMFDSNGF